MVFIQKYLELLDIQPFIDRLPHIADKFLHGIQHGRLGIGVICVIGVRQ